MLMQWHRDNGVDICEAVRIADGLAHSFTKIFPDLLLPLVFELVHQFLDQRLFCKEEMAGCVQKREPACEHLFRGISCMPVKIGCW